MEPKTPAPLLSVVIIGRNEGRRLERCLVAVGKMRDPGGRVEVIYVDSASTDGSPESARSQGADVISVHLARPTAALGRNAGWRASSGQFILFLDGDTILDPAFVQAALSHFTNDIAVVFGNRREIHPEASVFNRVLDLDWISPAGFVESCGGDAIIRREALEAVGGYDETLIAGEEPEMCRRMRGLDWKILHVDLPMTGHDLAITQWSQYLRRAKRTGYAYAEVSSRYRQTATPLWSAEARHNRNHALLHLIVLGSAMVVCLFERTLWPLLLVLVGLLCLSVRSASRISSKSPSFLTRFLYGVHSHLQQVPIYLGQVEYRRDRRNGRVRGLIEYKEVAP